MNMELLLPVMSNNSVLRSPTSESTVTTTSATAPVPPPPPAFIFRGHDAPVNALEFFNSNALLATGDDEGWIYIWDLWKRRQIFKWHAHPSASILALKAVTYYSGHNGLELDARDSKKYQGKKQDPGSSRTRMNETGFLLSHGRDHVIHIWDIRRILEKSQRSKPRADHASRTEQKHDAFSAPELVYSLPVNALNFCAMSVLVIEAQQSSPAAPDSSTSKTAAGAANDGKEPSTTDSISAAYQHLYIAVPSTTEVSKIDVYDLAKPERTFAAIGRPLPGGAAGSTNSRAGQSAVMAIQIFRTQHQQSEQETDLETNDKTGSSLQPEQLLRILAGYECGTVTLFREEKGSVVASDPSGKSKRKMEVVWSIQLHKEPVLSLDISEDLRYGASCGADNTLVKYTLSNAMPGVPETLQISLKTSGGRGPLKIRSDGKIVVVAGWDGKIRVFAFKSLKPLAVLKYHREDLKCLALACIIQDEPPKKTAATASTAENTQYKAKGDDGDSSGEEHDESDSDEDSDEDSDREEMLASQEKWFQRHWIAAAGKENRISLWDIY